MALRTDDRPDGHIPSYRDATAHLKNIDCRQIRVVMEKLFTVLKGFYPISFAGQYAVVFVDIGLSSGHMESCVERLQYPNRLGMHPYRESLICVEHCT